METIGTSTPLQALVDPFVKEYGGELVPDLIGNNNPPSSADYLFRTQGVIAELKSLEKNSFGVERKELVIVILVEPAHLKS